MLLFEVVSDLGQGHGALARADERLTHDAGEPVRAAWASQGSAGTGAVRAVLPDWTALSRSIISSRSASRSPSARICPGRGRASSSRAARTASIGSLLPARRLPACRVLSISATYWPAAARCRPRPSPGAPCLT